MAIYTFVNGRRKREFTYNPRVIVNGTIKKIVGGYTFINGERHKLFGEWSFDNTKLYTEDVMDILSLGHYQIVLRGAGGASGKNGTSRGGSTGGKGGAGAKGEIATAEFDIYNDTKLHFKIGKGGSASNGNGGAAGVGGESNNGGGGGDAGKPSYVRIYGTTYYADGGAGGGGGGGSAGYGRNSDGGAGGGGGGLYKTELGEDIIIKIISVPGKQGAPSYNNRAGVDGTAGNTADYPDLRSGGGEAGYNRQGSSGAAGGGASGGSGGGAGNDNAGSGGGGAGAGGSDKAGGGGATEGVRPGAAASNHFTDPEDTLEENSSYGVNANYGMGGGNQGGGSNGFILVRRMEGVPVPRPVEINNLGEISTTTPTETDDAGYVVSVVEEDDDAGAITGTVESSDDAGTIYTEIESTPWILGLITETVSETTNCGNIM